MISLIINSSSHYYIPVSPAYLLVRYRYYRQSAITREGKLTNFNSPTACDFIKIHSFALLGSVLQAPLRSSKQYR
jgi:hypothetical protein